MKIISKYKDFYDYLVQDYDSDLVYIRNAKAIDKNYNRLFNVKDYNILNYSDSFFGKYNHYSGELTFYNFIFGIYPYVYSQPVLRVYYTTKYNALQYFYIVLGHDLVDKILNDEYIDEAVKELENLAQTEFNKLVNKGLADYTKVSFFNKNTLGSINNSLSRRVWKQECKEIFRKIGSPIFVNYDKDLFYDGVYRTSEHLFGGMNTPFYIADVSLSKLNYNILKYWYNDLYDINTYNNIENFLWSIKQEPESKPDNRTKILSHGFDLKTSFRKM